MSQDKKHLSASAMVGLLQPWVDARKSNVTIVGDTLGTALASLPHAAAVGLDSMDMHELMNAFTAATVGKQIPNLVALHAKLVELVGVGVQYSFGYADRYAMVYADTPEFKSMAFQTQNLTYMVALKSATAYCWSDNPEACVSMPTWRLEMRLCTARPHSWDHARPALDSLQLLKSPQAMKDSEYFRYKDGRDRGYLCSLRPVLFNRESSEVVFETKDMHWGSAMSHLTGIFYDLSAHASTLDELEP